MDYVYPTAGPWSSGEIGILRARVAKGGRRKEICCDVSQAIGRSPKAVHTKMFVEGMRDDSERRLHTSLRGMSGPTAGGPPLDLGAGDDRYVARLMDLGGFASFVRLNDGRVIFGHNGKTWVQP